MQEAASANPVVRFYYNNRMFMAFCCISCEVAYLAVYAMCHPLAPKITFLAPAPLLSYTRQLSQCAGSASADFLPAALLALASLGCAVKQVVNGYQLVGAMQKLAALERKRD